MSTWKKVWIALAVIAAVWLINDPVNAGNMAQKAIEAITEGVTAIPVFISNAVN